MLAVASSGSARGRCKLVTTYSGTNLALGSPLASERHKSGLKVVSPGVPHSGPLTAFQGRSHENDARGGVSDSADRRAPLAWISRSPEFAEPAACRLCAAMRNVALSKDSKRAGR